MLFVLEIRGIVHTDRWYVHKFVTLAEVILTQRELSELGYNSFWVYTEKS